MRPWVNGPFRLRRIGRTVAAAGAVMALVFGSVSGAQASPAQSSGIMSTAAPTPTTAHTVTFDGYSFLVDGTRTYLWSGEFHYFRLPSPSLWLDIFPKNKGEGKENNCST